MISKYIEQANFEDTGFSYTLSLISGKYKMVILYCLMEFEPVRFNALRRYLPPKVEYSLTARGKSLMKVLDQLCTWGENNRDWTPEE